MDFNGRASINPDLAKTLLKGTWVLVGRHDGEPVPRMLLNDAHFAYNGSMITFSVWDPNTGLQEVIDSFQVVEVIGKIIPKIPSKDSYIFYVNPAPDAAAPAISLNSRTCKISY